MLLLIILISVGITFWGVYDDDCGEYNLREIFGSFAIIIGVIAYVIVLSMYPFNIDKRIAMYEEENKKIEEKVKDTVKAYMEYESDTLTKLIDTSDLTTLLVKYPELNSNELVKHEIQVYIDNSDTIKTLKNREISKSTFNFWLYFGK